MAFPRGKLRSISLNVFHSIFSSKVSYRSGLSSAGLYMPYRKSGVWTIYFFEKVFSWNTLVKVPPLGLPLFHCPLDSASTPPESLWYPYEVLLLPSLITRSREWQAIYQEYLLYMIFMFRLQLKKVSIHGGAKLPLPVNLWRMWKSPRLCRRWSSTRWEA